MAALGWLVGLADRKARRRRHEIRRGVRKAAEKTPADLQGALGLVLPLLDPLRQRRGLTRRPASLSRAAPTDPLALWAYLNALGGRQLGPGQPLLSRGRGAEQTDTTPRLPAKDELDHVLACYQRPPAADGPSWPRRRSSRTSPTS